MRKPLLFFSLLICALSLRAQQVLDYYGNNNAVSPISLGVHLGTQGFGLNIAYKQNDLFAYRLSISDAPLGFTNTRSWGSQQYDLHMNAKYVNLAAQFEYRPFNTQDHTDFTRKLVAVGGVAYFFKAQADVKATPKNDYKYGDIIIDKNDLGHVYGKAKWKSVAPYLGVGLRELKVSSRLFVNVDLGTYYLSSPDVTITGDKLLDGNNSNQKTVQQNLKNYHWLPVIQGGLSYRF